ncbi:MAG TPA: hypothetical protein DER12_00060 [Lachnospiraceae bacterium]|jgi:hypothetical protein|nr:hypothetical protein [Lachnospiraceae bacterium]
MLMWAFSLEKEANIQKIFQKILRPTAIKPYLWSERECTPLCGYADGSHELQNTNSGGGIDYDGV